MVERLLEVERRRRADRDRHPRQHAQGGLGRHEPLHHRPAAGGQRAHAVEQSIGRGLRLPYGKRTGVAGGRPADHRRARPVPGDHRRGQEGRTRSPHGASSARTSPRSRSRRSCVAPMSRSMLGITSHPTTEPGDACGSRGRHEDSAVPAPAAEVQEARGGRGGEGALEAIAKFVRDPQSCLAEGAPDATRCRSGSSPGQEGETRAQLTCTRRLADEELVASCARPPRVFIELTIDIPRVIVLPEGRGTCGLPDFDLDFVVPAPAGSRRSWSSTSTTRGRYRRARRRSPPRNGSRTTSSAA